MRTIRRHTLQGIEEVDLWLDQIKFEERGSVPPILLDDPRFTEELKVSTQIDETRQFATRFEWGVYVEDVLRDLPTRTLTEDVGLWTWLTLLYFDQVCPADSDGKRKVRARPNYVPSVSDYKSYYRHYLLSPWRIVRAHRDKPERARALLINPLYKPGELAEQGAAYRDVVSNPAVMEAVGELYLDPSSGTLKRGSGGSGPGSPRRLVAVLDQLSLTFDFQQIGADALLKLLPKEFKKFRTRAAGASVSG